MGTYKNCIAEIVGFDSACDSNDVRYKIQQLPGMGINMGAHLSNSEYQTGREMYQRAIDFAADNVSQLMQQSLFSVLIPSVLDYTWLCNPTTNPNKIVWAGNANQYGAQIIFNSGSENSENTIESIKVLSQNTGSYDLTITENDGATTVKTVNLIANTYTEISLGYVAKTNKVFLTFDGSTGLILGGYKCDGDVATNNCNCGGAKRTGYAQNSKALVYGYDSSQPTTANNTIFGIQPKIKIACNPELVVCAFKKPLGMAVLYLAGAALLQESLLSNRINVTTIESVDERKAAMKMWTESANKIIAQVALSVQNFAANQTQDSCFVCTGNRAGWSIG